MTTKTRTKKKFEELSEETFRHYPTYEAWKKIGFSPRFGILAPLGYMRSKRNQGIGDFADISLFKDFSKTIGSSIIQLLPLNDMGRGKVPYSSLSAFALDPIYIALDEIAEIKENPCEEIKKYLRENWYIVEGQKKAKLMDIDKLRAFKFGALYKLFWDFVKRNKNRNTPRWRDFQSYIYNNKFWLDDYAIFRTLKNYFNWTPWQEWPESYRDRHPSVLEQFKRDNFDELLFVKFVQWTAYTQLLKAHNLCRKDGVLIKGDIPLLVDFESADVWAYPRYFNSTMCAGAPPDQYSKEGQNWGSPTYNWDQLGFDNYIWWRKRLEYASHFYDIFRIDHVVGLFRIWTIPITSEYPRGTAAGWNGYFDPEDSGEGIYKPVWENHGKTLLKMMVNSCEMLPIGEDLGTIPLVCRSVLKNMGIPGYKVLIWERNWKEEDAPFYNPEEYNFMSMTTSTTHDFWSLAGYWTHKEENPEFAKEHKKTLEDLWKFIMGDKPFNEDFTAEFHKAIMKKLFHSGSIFLIMPFADLWGKVPGLFGEDIDMDRINDPSSPGRAANWAVKMPLNLEELADNPDVKDKIEMILQMGKSSGRVK